MIIPLIKMCGGKMNIPDDDIKKLVTLLCEEEVIKKIYEVIKKISNYNESSVDNNNENIQFGTNIQSESDSPRVKNVESPELVKGMQRKLDGYISEQKKLEETITEKDEKITNLTVQNDTLQKENEKFFQSVSDKKIEIEQKNTEQKKLEEIIKEKDENITKLTVQNDKLLKEKEEISRSVSNKNKEIEQKNTEQKKLEEIIKEKDENITNLTVQNDVLKAARDSLLKKNEENSKLMTSMQSEMDGRKTLIEVYITEQKKLKAEKESLQKQVDDLTKTGNYLKDETIQLNKEIIQLKDNLKQKELAEIELQKFFKEAKIHFERYSKLSDSVKAPLRGVFKGDTAEMFICAGVQWENIEAIWAFLQTQVGMSTVQSSTPMLVEMFKYFFNLYNSMQDRPVYQMQEVYLDETFDEDKHSRSNNSSVRGKICEILLPGYVNVRTGKIIKTIVRVR